MNGDPQTVAIKTKHLSDEIPRPGNGIALEIIAEREVAHHFEEHQVPLGATNIV